jgi:hypothetical protein
MSDPVNLNKARKARAKIKKRVQADENAVIFGLSKEKRTLEKARVLQEKSKLDAHKREPE